MSETMTGTWVKSTKNCEVYELQEPYFGKVYVPNSVPVKPTITWQMKP
jgi:hypothetical protein